jgi:Mn2+/Fe2+ NRAMP family transporter
MDIGVQLPADGGDPGDQRAHWPGHWLWHRRQSTPHYPAWLSGSIVLLLLFANLINLGADLGAMGTALKLMIGGPALVYVVLFAALSAGLQIFTRYARYVSILKWDACRCSAT